MDEPRGVGRGVEEANAVCFILQKGLASLNVLLDAVLAFLAQIPRDAARLNDIPHEALEHVGVEVVRHKDPRLVGVRGDGVGFVLEEVRLGTHGGNAGEHKGATGDVQRDGEVEGAVPLVLVTAAVQRSTGLRAEIQLVVADGRLRGKVSPRRRCPPGRPRCPRARIIPVPLRDASPTHQQPRRVLEFRAGALPVTQDANENRRGGASRARRGHFPS